MCARQVRYESSIPAPVEELFEYHARPGALDRLMPPWVRVRLMSHDGGIRDGASVVMRIYRGPLWRTWIADHFGYVKGRQFCDRQIRGPFAHWVHTHGFVPLNDSNSRLTDHIEYRLPLSLVSGPFFNGSVRRTLDRVFAYRHRVTVADLAAAGRYRKTRPWRIVLCGHPGLTTLVLGNILSTSGHDVTHSPDPANLVATLAKGSSVPIDAVVYLAGRNLTAQRHQTSAAKTAAAGLDGIRAEFLRLSQFVAQLEPRPRVLLIANDLPVTSADPAMLADERSASARALLLDQHIAETQGSEPAVQAGIRVVAMRLAAVLAPREGWLSWLAELPPHERTGPQSLRTMAWLSMDDAAGAIQHCLFTPDVRGEVHAAAPELVTLAELAQTLEAARRGTAVGSAAEAAIRQPLLFSSGEPPALLRSGYVFRHPRLVPALNHLFGKDLSFPSPTSIAPAAARSQAT